MYINDSDGLDGGSGGGRVQVPKITNKSIKLFSQKSVYFEFCGLKSLNSTSQKSVVTKILKAKYQ